MEEGYYGDSYGDGLRETMVLMLRRLMLNTMGYFPYSPVPSTYLCPSTPYIHPYVLRYAMSCLSLQKREMSLPKPPNFPRCYPLVYHDIDAQITDKAGHKLVKFSYFTWMGMRVCCLAYVLACFVCVNGGQDW